MSSFNLNSILSKNVLDRNVFIYGAEEFLVEDSLNKILNRFYPNTENDYSFNKIDATETPIGSLIDIANTFSMLGDKTTIVCKNIDVYFKGKRSKTDKELNKFLNYIQNPLDTTICIFCSQNEKLTSSKAKSLPSPYQQLIDNFDSISHPKVWPNQFQAWTKSRLEQNKINVDNQVIEILLSQTPQNLRDINNQIEKIKTAAIETEINTDTILNIIGSSRKYNIYELQKAITSKRLPDALSITENIYKNSKDSITTIISVLNSFFTKVLLLKDLRNSGLNQYELATKIGVPSFFLKDYMQSVDLFSTEELENLFILLAETDFNIKFKNENRLILIENMIIDIINDNNLSK